MQTLQLLLNRLHSGHIPISPEMITKTQQQGHSLNYQPGKIHVRVHADLFLITATVADELQSQRNNFLLYFIVEFVLPVYARCIC